jgi:hypothetical protein
LAEKRVSGDFHEEEKEESPRKAVPRGFKTLIRVLGSELLLQARDLGFSEFQI